MSYFAIIFLFQLNCHFRVGVGASYVITYI